MYDSVYKFKFFLVVESLQLNVILGKEKIQLVERKVYWGTESISLYLNQYFSDFFG
jgi:hypothetical protein